MGSATIFSGTKVKHLKSTSSLNGGAERTSGTADPTSSATDGVAGSIYQNISTGAIYRKLDSGSSTNWELVGAGGIPFNYATGNDSTADTALGAGWTTYDDAAAVPVDGLGGTVSLTMARTTSSPLHGAGSMLWTPVAAATGEGAAFTWIMNRRDLAAMMEIRFAYEIGTPSSYTEGDAKVYVISASDSGFTTNLEVVQAIPVNIGKSLGQELFRAVWQSHASNLYHKVLVHQATTATGYTIKIDDFFVGPQAAATLGAPITDWSSSLTLTPSAGFGTVGNTDYKTRRVGDSLEVEAYWTNGTVAGSVASLTLPGGYAIDTTKLDSNGGTPNASQVGDFNVLYVGANAVWGDNFGKIFYDGSTTNKVFFAIQSGGVGYVKNNANGFSSSSDAISLCFSVPILGWSSNTQMSDSADTRVVAAKYTSSATNVGTGDTTVIFPTKVYDTHSAYDTATGTLTIPVAGVYRFTCMQDSASQNWTAGNDFAATLYVNGSAKAVIFDTKAQTTFSGGRLFGQGSTEIQLNAGDAVLIKMLQQNAGAIDNTATSSYFTVSRISGPAQVAASELVSARYYASATSISGSLTTINYTTKDYDSHGAYSAGTVTVPSAGKYLVNAGILITGTIALNNTLVMEIQKNGTVVSRETVYFAATLTDGTGIISDIVNCSAGDTIRIQVSTSATGPSIVSSNFDNYLSVARLGV